MLNRPCRLGAAAISGALIVVMASPVSAQLVVYDAATTARIVSAIMFVSMAASVNAGLDIEALVQDIKTQISLLIPR